MPDLVLLNGPPASGKSTIAALLVATRTLALNLDMDVVRGALGGWADLPHESGLAARRLAIAMAAAHLGHGHDVVVPQLLASDTFVRELHDRLMAFLDTRPNVRRVDVIRGDIESTLSLVESAIAA